MVGVKVDCFAENNINNNHLTSDAVRGGNRSARLCFACVWWWWWIKGVRAIDLLLFARLIRCVFSYLNTPRSEYIYSLCDYTHLKATELGSVCVSDGGSQTAYQM